MKLKQSLAIAYIRTKFKILATISKRKAAEEAFTLFCTPLIKPIKEIPQLFKEAESLQFESNGLKVQGYRWNHPQQKKVMVLHGFSSAACKFERYIASLIDKGYEVLAFDAPAHGNSEGKTVNVVQYSDMVKKAMSLYGPIDSFIAHSFGGLAISLTLEVIPHDEHTKVVFIAPATETTSAVKTAFEILQLHNSKVKEIFNTIIYELGGKPTEWYSIKRAMKNIKAKILWIHDEEDDVTPIADVLKVKEEHYPNIEYIFTKGLGHRKIYRDNAVRNAVINFL
ncbi:MAG TPA: alpha/beta fold hydrolase [Ferruginibacter sp.]|nr:alpha/beta fold hydrolase [Ferruginibacter sp.]